MTHRMSVLHAANAHGFDVQRVRPRELPRQATRKRWRPMRSPRRRRLIHITNNNSVGRDFAVGIEPEFFLLRFRIQLTITSTSTTSGGLHRRRQQPRSCCCLTQFLLLLYPSFTLQLHTATTLHNPNTLVPSVHPLLSRSSLSLLSSPLPSLLASSLATSTLTANSLHNNDTTTALKHFMFELQQCINNLCCFLLARSPWAVEEASLLWLRHSSSNVLTETFLCCKCSSTSPSTCCVFFLCPLPVGSGGGVVALIVSLERAHSWNFFLFESAAVSIHILCCFLFSICPWAVEEASLPWLRSLECAHWNFFLLQFFSLGPLPVGTGGGSIALIATQEQYMKLSSFCSKVSYHPQIDLFSISPLPVGTGVGNGPNWIQQHWQLLMFQVEYYPHVVFVFLLRLCPWAVEAALAKLFCAHFFAFFFRRCLPAVDVCLPTY